MCFEHVLYPWRHAFFVFITSERSIWKLFKDGNTLTDNYNEISPTGSAATVDYVCQRKGQGSAFAGTWVSTSETVNFAYVLQVRPYQEDGLSIVDSSSQLTRNMKLDGKDYPNTGANAAIIAVSSIRRVDAHTLELTDKKSDGKAYSAQQIKLSSDLKTLTMTPHNAGRDEPDRCVGQTLTSQSTYLSDQKLAAPRWATVISRIAHITLKNKDEEPVNPTAPRSLYR